jgi:hypothetical protein
MATAKELRAAYQLLERENREHRKRMKLHKRKERELAKLAKRSRLSSYRITATDERGKAIIGTLYPPEDKA